MKKILFVSLLSFALVGCAVKKDWQAINGSRADATIELSYDYGLYEIPQISEQQAIELATRKCNTWGYTGGAQAFGGERRTCDYRDRSGSCQHFIVTKEYQCTDSGN